VKDNHKCTYRVYKEEGLNLRSKKAEKVKGGGTPPGEAF
jgi:hypothetical protein